MEKIKYKQMEVFVACAQEYDAHRTEIGKSTLLQQLQFLGATADLSVFDPGSPVTSQFYMRLYDLMKSSESHSSLTWAAVACLKHACNNSAARVALTHTYKFNQILARFLSPLPAHEKLVQLLCLLEDMSYGIKFNWQEAHLPAMMKSLAALITGNNKAYVRASLTIMINLCYKNLPAVYALMRTVDQTSFLESIRQLGKEDTYTHVQVFRLLYTLEYVTDEISGKDILQFVSETFTTLCDAFKAGNVVLMRQIVDFFHDVQSNDQTKEEVLSYDGFLEDTNKLMDLLDNNPQDPQRVGVLFEFAHSLVTLKILDLRELYPRLVQLSLGYIHTKLACTSALYLLQEIVADQFVDKDMKTNIMTALDERLEIILLSLENRGDAENRSRLTALMNLLKTICTHEEIRDRVLSIVPPENVLRLFTPLINPSKQSDDENMFDSNYSKLYVYTLDFISELTSHVEFKRVYTSLLQQKKIHMILALALYVGDVDLKIRVLRMTRTEAFPEESLQNLSRTLGDLEPMVVQLNGARGKPHLCSIDNGPAMPLFGPSQEVRLNELIKQTNDVVENAKRGESVLTSSLMKLYEYKLASASHNERQLESQLATATDHSTKLQHHLAQVSAEASRLQREIYQNEEYIEDMCAGKEEADFKLRETQKALESAQQRNLQNIANNEREIKDLHLTIDELRSALHTRSGQLSVAVEEAQGKSKELIELREVHVKTVDENESLTAALSRVEAAMADLSKRLDGKNAEVFLIVKQSQETQEDKERLEQLLREKNDRLQLIQCQLDAKNGKLSELERIRDRIFEISAPKPGLPALQSVLIS